MIASSSTVVTAMRTCPPGGENFKRDANDGYYVTARVRLSF